MTCVFTCKVHAGCRPATVNGAGFGGERKIANEKTNS